MKVKLYYVEWIDSQRGGGWIQAVDAMSFLATKTIKDNLCITVGYKIHEDSLTETFVPHLGIQPVQFSGEMTIPKVAIIRKKLIKGFDTTI